MVSSNELKLEPHGFLIRQLRLHNTAAIGKESLQLHVLIIQLSVLSLHHGRHLHFLSHNWHPTLGVKVWSMLKIKIKNIKILPQVRIQKLWAIKKRKIFEKAVEINRFTKKELFKVIGILILNCCKFRFETGILLFWSSVKRYPVPIWNIIQC